MRFPFVSGIVRDLDLSQLPIKESIACHDTVMAPPQALTAVPCPHDHGVAMGIMITQIAFMIFHGRVSGLTRCDGHIWQSHGGSMAIHDISMWIGFTQIGMACCHTMHGFARDMSDSGAMAGIMPRP